MSSLSLYCCSCGTVGATSSPARCRSSRSSSRCTNARSSWIDMSFIAFCDSRTPCGASFGCGLVLSRS
eukprot:1540325-Amphidinium_carterae.1